LHNNTGAGVSGIHTTYDEETTPDGPGDLADFSGRETLRNWRLKITNAGNKTGTLENWTLHLKSNIPFNCHPVGCGEGVPTAVGNTLMLTRTAGGTDVSLSWSGVGAANYNVWRSTDPQFGSAAFAGASGGATALVDGGAQLLPGVHFYQVRSVNGCRWESD